ncbi:hypothetical protein HQ447_08705 [bacterium]|nr:hypothetical protein [bacterium]
MKSTPHRLRCLSSSILLISWFAAPLAVAGTYYWDTNNATGGVGGTANWTATSTNWSSSPAGAAATVLLPATSDAIFAGTAGTVSLSSSSQVVLSMAVNVSGYTLRNSSTATTASNRYFESTNGITLANGVNLNISSGVTVAGALTGLRGSSTTTTVAGGTGSSITITGDTGTGNASNRIGVGLDSMNIAASAPITIATTGDGYTYLTSAVGSRTIDASITINSGSRLTLSGSTSATARTLTVNGVISGSTGLTVGESANTGSTLRLNGINTYTGGTLVTVGSLGYGNIAALGAGTVTLSNGVAFGQSLSIAGTTVDRTLANNLNINGDVTLGLGTFTNTLGGNVNLAGATRVITLANSTTMSGVISNGGLTVASTSVTRSLTLNGSNTYAGLTTVQGGQLIVNGSLHASSNITVALGAQLGGGGSIAGDAVVNGTLAPGTSLGTLSLDDLTLSATSNYTFELTGGALTADLSQVAGLLTLASGSVLNLVQLGGYTANDKFTLFSYGTLDGTFTGLADEAEFTAAGGIWKINYHDLTPGSNGGTGSNFVTITAIPEPAAALLGGIGLLILLSGRRRRL